MKPTARQLAIAAMVIAAVIAAVRQGTVTPVRTAGHIEVPWTGPAATAQARCITCDVKVDSDEVEFRIFQRQDGGPEYTYATIRVCANPVVIEDQDDFPRFPGITPVRDSCVMSDYVAGAPRLSIWRQGHASNPAPCACGTPTSCEILTPAGAWVAAPKGTTFQPGKWRDKAPGKCVRKACIELAGSTSMPAACE